MRSYDGPVPTPQVTAIDGSRVDAWVLGPCGERAAFDKSSGCAYRCQSCFAVLGSCGMPKQCSDLYPKDGK